MARHDGIRHSRLVRGHASKLLLAVGCLVVLVLAIGLVQMTRGAPEAATPPRVAEAPIATPEAAVAEPIAPGAPASAARERAPVRSAPARVATMPTRRPEIAPAPPSVDRELKRDANGKLVPVITVHELRDNLHRIEAATRACIEQSGQRATGEAILGFTVAPKDNKLAIETTSIQDEGTLAGNAELLDCMQRTATGFAPVFEGRPVPELGTPIYVRRRVRLEAGALVENTLFNFSYNP
jgi:hypothetical protein